jgi:hypothetical protein
MEATANKMGSGDYAERKDSKVARHEQRYAEAGITGAIAARAAELKAQQQAGEELGEIGAQIVDFADRNQAQHEELQTLSQYGADLDRHGFEAIAADYSDRIPDLRDNPGQHRARAANGEEVDWVADRQRDLMGDLQRQGSLERQVEQEVEQGNRDLGEVMEQQFYSSGNEDDDDSTDDETDDETEEQEESPFQEEQVDNFAIIENARRLHQAAQNTPLVKKAGNTSILQGDRYSVVQSDEVTIVQGRDRARAIADGDRLLEANGFTKEDERRWQELGKTTAEQLQQSNRQIQERENLRRENSDQIHS